MEEKTKHFSWLRLIPLIILLLGLGAFFYFRLYEYVNLETLKAHRSQLLQWTIQYPILIAGSFILIYTIAVAISMPQAIFLTILGGFLFGPIFGTIYVVIGATIGATIIVPKIGPNKNPPKIVKNIACGIDIATAIV